MTTYILSWFNFYYLDQLRKVLDSSDLNLANEMHLLLNNSTGTIGHFKNLILGNNNNSILNIYTYYNVSTNGLQGILNKINRLN